MSHPIVIQSPHYLVLYIMKRNLNAFSAQSLVVMVREQPLQSKNYNHIVVRQVLLQEQNSSLLSFRFGFFSDGKYLFRPFKHRIFSVDFPSPLFFWGVVSSFHQEVFGNITTAAASSSL